jgi:hypothetical protein
MATNWLMELTKLSKTDKTAKELLSQLKAASTDEEKEKAKQNGKEYIQALQETATTTIPEQETTEPTKEPEVEPATDDDTEDTVVDSKQDTGYGPVDAQKTVDKKYDMSEPAFNPRLAKMGITREEELFKLGVLVRKMTRDEKIAIRRSIYQKKKQYMSATQEKFKKQQAEARAAREADPEYQKYMHQRQFVLKIEEALKNHCNIEWMFRNIEGLNPDVMRELLQKPENVNRFRAQKETFVDNFYKKYGK